MFRHDRISPMVLKLQSAKRVGDALEGVTYAVGVVVHRVDDPLVPC
jgi:hypothetical protein